MTNNNFQGICSCGSGKMVKDCLCTNSSKKVEDEMSRRISVSFIGDEDALFDEIPIVKQALYFMQTLKAHGKFKATKLGNLPRFLVQDIYHKFFSEDFYTLVPYKEQDLYQLVRLKLILEIIGLIDKRKNSFVLTDKGDDYLKKENIRNLFNEILLTSVRNLNWAYGDRMPEWKIIQENAAFNLYFTKQECQDWISDKKLGKLYLEQFPALKDAGKLMGLFGNNLALIAFTIRFLDRFCLPLGLLECKIKKGKGVSNFGRKYYRVSSFFQKNFKFS